MNSANTYISPKTTKILNLRYVLLIINDSRVKYALKYQFNLKPYSFKQSRIENYVENIDIISYNILLYHVKKFITI